MGAIDLIGYLLSGLFLVVPSNLTLSPPLGTALVPGTHMGAVCGVRASSQGGTALCGHACLWSAHSADWGCGPRAVQEHPLVRVCCQAAQGRRGHFSRFILHVSLGVHHSNQGTLIPWALGTNGSRSLEQQIQGAPPAQRTLNL